jgi:hypothetical protein
MRLKVDGCKDNDLNRFKTPTVEAVEVADGEDKVVKQ